jgi:cAMP-dependent protein kinase regulator
VDFVVGGEKVGTAGSGSTFGELALLYQAPRAATCIAKEDCALYRLDQEHFRRILMMQAEDQVSDVVKVLRKVPYFKDLGTEQLNKIAANLHVKHFKDGELMARSDDKDFVPRFSIVVEGSLLISDIQGGGADYKELTFGPGEFFGDSAIVTGKRIMATVKAQGDVTILTMKRETFVRVVGDNIEELVQLHMDVKMLVSLFPFSMSDILAAANI